MNDYFTLQEAANFTGIPYASIRYAAHVGQLPHIKVGRNLLFLRADIEAYAAAQRTLKELQTRACA